MTRTPEQLGIELRDSAIDAVERANTEWIERAYQAVRTLATKNAIFTSDDVWVAVEGEPREPRAMGAAMRRAALDGIIVATDRTVLSLRPNCHRRPIRVWRSLVRGREILKEVERGP
jgi:hypothetical protein